MATRKPVSLVKGDQSLVETWPGEPNRFAEEHVDPFLLWCVKKGTSDISIQTDRTVYTEVHGILYPATNRAHDAADMTVFLTRIYGPDANARLASGSDMDVSYEIKPDRYSRVRFRVNISAILARGRDAAHITMRVLPSEPPRMSDLNI